MMQVEHPLLRIEAVRHALAGHKVLACGATLLLPNTGKFDSKGFWQDAHTFHMTQAVLVPTMIQQLLAEAKENFSGSKCLSLRRFWSTGASLPAAVRDSLQEILKIPVCEVRSPWQIRSLF